MHKSFWETDQLQQYLYTRFLQGHWLSTRFGGDGGRGGGLFNMGAPLHLFYRIMMKSKITMYKTGWEEPERETLHVSHESCPLFSNISSATLAI